jgi:hypothetical protein
MEAFAWKGGMKPGKSFGQFNRSSSQDSKESPSEYEFGSVALNSVARQKVNLNRPRQEDMQGLVISNFAHT